MLDPVKTHSCQQSPPGSHLRWESNIYFYSDLQDPTWPVSATCFAVTKGHGLPLFVFFFPICLTPSEQELLTLQPFLPVELFLQVVSYLPPLLRSLLQCPLLSETFPNGSSRSFQFHFSLENCHPNADTIVANPPQDAYAVFVLRASHILSPLTLTATMQGGFSVDTILQTRKLRCREIK